MSRIGRMPIQVPSSVKVVLDQQDVAVEGPKGRLSRVIPEGIKIGLADGVITIERLSNQKLHRSLHGLIRSLVANMVVGVTEGFEKKLLLVGTGYRAEVDRQSRLVLNVGYSHSVIYPPPDGITLNTGDSETVSGPPYIPIYIPMYGNAIMALGKLKSTAAVDELIKILEDQSLEMDHATDVTVKLSFRIKAADALAEIEDARAAEALGRRLVDESEYVVTAKDDLNRKGAWAWEALVNAAKPFQLPAFAASGLIERINQSAPEDWPIKAAATIALGGCNTAEVVPKLRELLTDPKKEVRQAAALGAGKPWHSELRDDLVKIMKGETEADIDVRRGATQGVGGLAHPSTVPHLAEVFNNDIDPEEIRRDAALALGKIGNDAAVSPLIEKLKALPSDQATKNFRLDIIKGLAEAKNQKAVSVLETAMDDQDTEIHFWAADALFQITGNEYGYHRAR